MRRGVQFSFERIRYADGVDEFVAKLNLPRNWRGWACGGDGIFFDSVQRKNALVAMAWRGAWRSCDGFVVDIE